MAFFDTQRRIWRENLLFSVLVELTYRCNLDCSFCYNDTNLRGTPLSREQYFRFFEDLRDLGTLNLTFSGGEPFAHPDFFTLGSKARDLGFVVRVKTNGHALRGALARRLKEEIDPFIVEVSLHGASAQTHDRQTRVPGSFARLMDNLLEAQAFGLRLKLNSPLTAWNEHEIEPLFALADRLQARIQFDTDITRRDDGDAAPLDIAPSRDGLARLYEVQLRRAAANEPDVDPDDVAPGATAPASAAAPASEKHCGAGSNSITVDPYGNVYPCVQWRRRVGNLHQDSVQTLWKGSPELDAVRRLTVDVKQTLDGLQPGGFPFCPGLAEKESGHATRLYPTAQVMLDLRRRRPVT
jgi:mycofactocin biosynthetic radical S-adenosylmethionine protein MftC